MSLTSRLWVAGSIPAGGASAPAQSTQTPATIGIPAAGSSINPRYTYQIRTVGRALLVVAAFLWKSVIAVLLFVAYAVMGVGVYFGLIDGDRPNAATVWLIGYLTVGLLAFCLWLVRVSKRWSR